MGGGGSTLVVVDDFAGRGADELARRRVVVVVVVFAVPCRELFVVVGVGSSVAAFFTRFRVVLGAIIKGDSEVVISCSLELVLFLASDGKMVSAAAAAEAAK